MSASARSCLFDAGTISLFYQGKNSVKVYFDRVFSGHMEGFISEINLAEFYYKSALVKGFEVVDVWYTQIRQSAFHIIAPNDAITRRAGQWKVRERNLSLADCFALATCEERAQVLLTTDPEIHRIKRIKTVYISPF